MESSIERIYSEPRKWMQGKGCEIIKFGWCYNYAVVCLNSCIIRLFIIRSLLDLNLSCSITFQDTNGTPSRIIREEEADQFPLMFVHMIKRMVKRDVLLRNYIPNSCIMNVYDKSGLYSSPY